MTVEPYSLPTEAKAIGGAPTPGKRDSIVDSRELMWDGSLRLGPVAGDATGHAVHRRPTNIVWPTMDAVGVTRAAAAKNSDCSAVTGDSRQIRGPLPSRETAGHRRRQDGTILRRTEAAGGRTNEMCRPGSHGVGCG